MAIIHREIAAMEASLESHKESYQQYVQIAESRIEIFNKISSLAEECKSLKLPVDTASGPSNPASETFEEKAAAVNKGNGKGKGREEEGERSGAMDVDLPSSSSGSRLNVQALPFQPTPATSSVPPPSAGAPISSRTMKPPPSSLPVRPQTSTITTSTSSRLAPPPMSRSTSSSLPSRPMSTGGSANAKAKGLEEGELNDAGEDGEVLERGSGSTSGRGVKRGNTSSGAEAMRGVRSRK